MTVYLDCNATTPMEPKVAEIVKQYMEIEFGNSGSRTHEYGAKAKQAIEKARDQVRSVVACEREEVLFTSGATESNNLAILGLAAEGEKTNRKHIVTTAIEHKAVLEPIEELGKRGFEVTILPVDATGRVVTAAVAGALRPDTLLVSIMQANNETGVVQPIEEISALLKEHEAFFHVDAAQGFGKEIAPLQNPRVDLISISGHKIYGPKGIGALIARRRGYRKVPLTPLVFGGGQERGLRPGTLPVPLIAGFGEAAALALKNHKKRKEICESTRTAALEALAPLMPQQHGDESFTLPHVLNVSFAGIDAEAAMVALKGIAAVSNGSACTSHSYTPSHVLEAMGLDEDEIQSAIRMSWCHLTGEVDWEAIRDALLPLRN